MARSKSAIYHEREYWYIGSTLAMSEMAKKRSEARAAAGTYPARVASSRSDAASAIFCLRAMSSDIFLEDERISMAVWSSRMLPSDSERTCACKPERGRGKVGLGRAAERRARLARRVPRRAWSCARGMRRRGAPVGCDSQCPVTASCSRRPRARAPPSLPAAPAAPWRQRCRAAGPRGPRE
eukprot:scaffold6363_cov25-Tisochrysis_lutea.AAC.8